MDALLEHVKDQCSDRHKANERRKNAGEGGAIETQYIMLEGSVLTTIHSDSGLRGKFVGAAILADVVVACRV